MLTPNVLASQSYNSAEWNIKHAQQACSIKQFWLIISGFIGLVVLFRIAGLFMEAAGSRLRLLYHGNLSAQTSWRRLLQALATVLKNFIFRSTLPIWMGGMMSYAELVLIGGYAIAVFTILFVHTSDLKESLWVDRAAVVAACQFPFIVALAGKTNIITLLTGISHERLNFFHRASARICLICLWVHALTHITRGISQSDIEECWFQWGASALVAFTLLAILGLRPLRRAAYEVFLASHIFLVVVFLVGAYIHTRQFDYETLIWPAFVIWAFDRTVRLLRIVYHNRLWRGLKGNPSAHATVELVSFDTIRVTLCRQLNWQAGQHAFLVFPSVSKSPFEAHPFTISTIAFTPEAQADKEVTFLIKSRAGITQRLRAMAERNVSTLVPAFVDGPYGCPPCLTSYRSCVIIAGGSGISYALPLLLDIIRNVRSGVSVTRKVLFLWAVRDPVHLSWLFNALESPLSGAPLGLQIDVRVHITALEFRSDELASPSLPRVLYTEAKASSLPRSSASIEEKDKFDTVPSVSRHLKTIAGRPNVEHILNEEIRNAEGPLSVEVAGPSGLSQLVRTALRSSTQTSFLQVMKGTPAVTLHMETFG